MSYKQLKDNKWSYKLLKVPYLEGFHPPPEEVQNKPADLYIQTADNVIATAAAASGSEQQRPEKPDESQRTEAAQNLKVASADVTSAEAATTISASITTATTESNCRGTNESVTISIRYADDDEGTSSRDGTEKAAVVAAEPVKPARDESSRSYRLLPEVLMPPPPPPRKIFFPITIF